MSTDLGTRRETDIAVALGGRKFDWQRLLKAVCVVVAILGGVALFYKRSYIGILSRDSIDIAQIAANISQGHGFTTRFVRPFNALYFKDVSGYYPELNHAPLFPYFVALLFKLRTVSEQVIVWASLLFFLLTSVATYVLGRLLFDWRVGLLATGIFSLSLAVLNAAISGEEWTMCAFLFTLLLCAMASHHTSADTRGGRHGIACAALSAVLLAALYMTHHILVILVLPTAMYFAVTGVRRRLYRLVFLGVWAAAVTPWAVRNGLAPGIPVLGASGWDIIANTSAYPGDTLYRTVELA
ncbi:MAG: glycosyltransferase family 39 protein, partial [Armatimonadetes bacterium]|nr:glycosyltransferase family 39 protein [Armatimonadota bacterium]